MFTLLYNSDMLMLDHVGNMLSCLVCCCWVICLISGSTGYVKDKSKHLFIHSAKSELLFSQFLKVIAMLTCLNMLAVL